MAKKSMVAYLGFRHMGTIPLWTMREFSFYDIESSPTMTYGFVSTGPGRAFYGEEYDFYHNVGTGYNFYFMIMDYALCTRYK